MDYSIQRSTRARTMRLTVRPDGRVVVVAPEMYRLATIERFVLKHAQWIERHVQRANKRTVVHISRGEIARLKQKAHILAAERCGYFSSLYKVTFKKIRVGAQKSRWGSCSRKGTLSFNYKLAVLPSHLADYLIVHEICHLAHFNHSADFWALVALQIPNHKVIRRELRNTVFQFSV